MIFHFSKDNIKSQSCFETSVIDNLFPRCTTLMVDNFLCDFNSVRYMTFFNFLLNFTSTISHVGASGLLYLS